MTKHELEAQQIAQEFWAMIETEATKLEITEIPSGALVV